MAQTKVLTQESTNNAESLAQLIATVPEKKKPVFIAILRAYIDGVLARPSFEDVMTDLDGIASGEATR